MPARERCSSKVPAYGAVLCQRTEPGGGWRKDRERASHNRLIGHSRGFWDDSETQRDGDVTNRSFPHQRYKPSRTEAYFDRKCGCHIADHERSEKLSDRAKC